MERISGSEDVSNKDDLAEQHGMSSLPNKVLDVLLVLNAYRDIIGWEHLRPLLPMTAMVFVRALSPVTGRIRQRAF
jgi:hypothetical protein